MVKDKSQLFQKHQEIVIKEAKEKDKEKKKEYQKQRLEIEKQQAVYNEDICKEYGKKAKEKPKPVPYIKNSLWAFVVGGIICTIGQALNSWFQNLGIDEKSAGAAVTSIIIIATGLLTGLGIFDDIGRRSGAGTIVPVTGFANSIVSAALEFKHEGIVYGVGAKLFTIAGPVIVYGTLVSVIIGLIYLIV